MKKKKKEKKYKKEWSLKEEKGNYINELIAVKHEEKKV